MNLFIFLFFNILEIEVKYTVNRVYRNKMH